MKHDILMIDHNWFVGAIVDRNRNTNTRSTAIGVFTLSSDIGRNVNEGRRSGVPNVDCLKNTGRISAVISRTPASMDRHFVTALAWSDSVIEVNVD